MSNSDDARAQARLATIREEISTRLWSVNAGMSSSDFNELIDQMALLQFSFEYRDRKPPRVDRRLGVGERRSHDEAIEPPTDPIA